MVVSDDQGFQAFSRSNILFIAKINQVLERDLQRSSQLVEVLEGKIPFASFDPAQIRRVQVRSLGEVLLGQTRLDAQFANSPPQSTQYNIVQ